MNLDPQIAALLDVLDAGFPPVHTMTGAQARAVIRSRYVPPAEPEPVAEVRDEVVPGPGGDIPVRIYRPTGENLPVLVYAHGGGFVFCDLDSHDGLCRSFANHVPAVVVSVAYRLAPEHPWPAAADDFYAVAQAGAAGAFGGDPGR
ncbi:MAG: acetyl esterase, partial [Mycobacterium sp.]|nr:acetyl esterase [Mycobacterium sp.]